MSNIIALFASARRNGNTGKLIDWIADELNIRVIDLADKIISPYDYDHKNIDDDFVPLINELLSYDKIIFVTPIYWYGPSAQMKIFIDRTSDLLDVETLKDIGRKLRNKTAYIACTSVNAEADYSFLKSLKDTFEYLGMVYKGHVHADCANGFIPANYRDDVGKFYELLSKDKA